MSKIDTARLQSSLNLVACWSLGAHIVYLHSTLAWPSAPKVAAVVVVMYFVCYFLGKKSTPHIFREHVHSQLLEKKWLQ